MDHDNGLRTEFEFIFPDLNLLSNTLFHIKIIKFLIPIKLVSVDGSEPITHLVGLHNISNSLLSAPIYCGAAYRLYRNWLIIIC